jgi:hypothetical protein
VKQIRQRLTYANVMSSIAVFFILGGATAFAATKIGANEIKANSIKTGKIVKEAVTEGKIKNGAVTTNKLANGAVTEGKLADNSVTTTKIADKAVTAAKINVTGLPAVPNAANAANAAALGGKAASEYSIRYFARVDGDTATPTLTAGSPGVTVNTARPFTGAATVVFPVDMTNCSITAIPFNGGGTVLVPRQSSISSQKNVVIILETTAGVSTNGSFNVEGVC